MILQDVKLGQPVWPVNESTKRALKIVGRTDAVVVAKDSAGMITVRFKNGEERSSKAELWTDKEDQYNWDHFKD